MVSYGFLLCEKCMKRCAKGTRRSKLDPTKCLPTSGKTERNLQKKTIRIHKVNRKSNMSTEPMSYVERKIEAANGADIPKNTLITDMMVCVIFTYPDRSELNTMWDISRKGLIKYKGCSLKIPGDDNYYGTNTWIRTQKILTKHNYAPLNLDDATREFNKPKL